MRPTPIDRAKKAAGFLHGGERLACQNCAHMVVVSRTGAPNDRWSMRCNRLGFGVTAMSVCNLHERKPVGGSV